MSGEGAGSRPVAPPSPRTPAALPYAVPRASHRAEASAGFEWLFEPVTGQIEKRVKCEKCGCDYLYELRRTVYAPSLFYVIGYVLFHMLLSLMMFRLIRFLRMMTHLPETVLIAREDALGSAYQRMRRRFLNEAEPVACPDCGWYQRDMVSNVRRSHLSWLRRISIAMLAGGPVLAIVIARLRWRGTEPEVWLAACFTYAISAVTTGAGLWLLRYGVSRGIDPNRGYPQSRQAYAPAPAAVKATDRYAAIAAATAKLTARTSKVRAPRSPMTRS